MSKSATDNVLLNEVRTIQRFWAEHPEIKLKETTCPGLKKSADDFEAASDQAGTLESQLHNQIAVRDQLGEELKLVATRIRSVVRGIYGPDSNEYVAVGGTRTSDRKRPVRRNGSGETPAPAPVTEPVATGKEN